MMFENLTIASYNIWGLTDKLKKVQLSKDLKFYNVNVCCVQETKITEDINTNIHDHQLICQKTNQKDYRNGFLKHTRLEQHIHKVWKINNIILILEIQIKPQYVCKQNGKAKITISRKRREVHVYPKRYKTQNTENTRKIFTKNS